MGGPSDPSLTLFARGLELLKALNAVAADMRPTDSASAYLQQLHFLKDQRLFPYYRISVMEDTIPTKLDAVSRRRLQNRLNQQASRKRKAIAKQSNASTRKWVVYTDEARALGRKERPDKQTVIKRSQKLEEPSKNCVDQDNEPLCTSNQVSRAQYLIELQRKVSNYAANNMQAANILLSVTQLNIMRAMVANAATMGLSMEVLCEDIASHFNISGPCHVTFQLPPSLQPSSSQKSIIHHPWIDIIPIESLRNSLLSQMGVYDEDELCIDFYGFCGPSSEVGLLVWGESWDPSAYEVTEVFFKKWNWLLRDCTDLIRSTNYWRRQRGEKPLKVESDYPRIKEVEE
ncbi:hypothetical protein PENSTE_c001G01357 [Penicillium steckii]|uniref:BZIP domain-containing protein n=1 Tax=Penicillium steckii TaxID=303698 RepID=A0A1V6U0W2_9EURO|nr:hypothetical protein PENSTE_c001G01357 [Penicillium steckii]